MMNSSLKTDQQQLRKVAILVATLDAALAERLLANLPARDAVAVQRIVDQLGDIDRAEYNAAVADFRQSIATHPRHRIAPPVAPLAGVELDESLVKRLADEEESRSPHAAESLSTVAPSAGPWHAFSDSETAPLVEMLSAEQPQTIAVVLSRLETARAAEFIGKLSPALQVEVLTRLADLDPADEETLHVVESQLAGWINQQRQRRQRLAAGRDMVQRILQSTPDSQRVVILTQLGKRNPALAELLFTPSDKAPPRETQPPVTQSNRTLPQAAPSHSTRFVADATSVTPKTYLPASSASSAAAPTPTKPTTESSDPLSELEALDDQSLLRGLRLAERQTVMLALAGASAELMNRVLQGLPRRQANRFRQQIRAIGPARLSEMMAAQRELVRCGQG